MMPITITIESFNVAGVFDSMINRRHWLASVLAVLLGLGCGLGGRIVQSNETEVFKSTRFLVQPDVQGDRIVFVSRGDIWAASSHDRWVAKNLTKSQEIESQPKLSCDGKWVAYHQSMNGVFVIPFEGGDSKRLTFRGGQGEVLDWTTDGRIAYTCHESSPFPDSLGLSFVNPRGGQPQHTGIVEISYAWFDPAGEEMLFSRSSVSTSTSAKFHGGAANQILKFSWKTGEHQHLFPSIWSRHCAVRYHGDIYFIGTEGDESLNLWSIDESGSPKQRTFFEIDGIRSLASDGQNIVLEMGGNLFHYVPDADRLDQIPIEFEESGSQESTTVHELAKSVDEISPTSNGNAIALTARGEVFVFANGSLLNITQGSPGNDSSIAWSPDGLHLAFLSDRTREEGIYVWSREKNEIRHLVTLGRRPVWLQWSPSGQEIYYLLDRESLHRVDTNNGEDTAIANVSRWTTGFSMSKSGKWVALITAQANRRTNVVLVDLRNRKSLRVTDPMYVDYACQFDREEDALHFLSRRNGRPDLSDDLPDLSLTGGMSLARIDLAQVSSEMPWKDIRSRTRWIDTQGVEVDTLRPHPIGLELTGKDGNYLLDKSNWSLKRVDDAPEVSWFTSVDGAARASLTNDRIEFENWRDGWTSSGSLALNQGLSVHDSLERESMFWFVHRFQRDHFYDPNMLGVDWRNVGDHYSRYLSRISTRHELGIVLSRMIGEVPGGHNGVSLAPSSPTLESLARAPESGLIVGWDGEGAKILRVLRGRTDMQMFGSLESGVEGKVLEGQYIRSVNGNMVDERTGFDERTVGIHPNDEVVLGVSDSLDGNVQSIKVRLLGNYLGYSDFLDRTTERVQELSGGRVGYTHIFDTYSQGGGTFSDGFYSQSNLEGFILDARWNRGGNSNPGFIDAMQARALFVEAKRYGEPSEDTASMTGPIALLVNRTTVSGGDLLASAFKSRSVGKVIGSRTAGRTIGNQWYGQMIDRSVVRTSESRHLDWVTKKDAGENVGIQPDLEIEMIPRIEFSVHDEQLEQAVKSILESIDQRN